MGERGLSLVEVLVVVSIMATLLCIGEGLVAAATRQQAKLVQTELAAELRTARHLAVIRRAKVRALFDLQEHAVRIQLADAPDTVIREYRFGERGVRVEGLSNGAEVTFYSSGRVATPTTIVLKDRRGDLWRMTVSLTGRITVTIG